MAVTASRPILDVANIHAVITTRWRGETYRALSVEDILSYSIETNLDEDSDPFTLVIGDMTANLTEMSQRDNEVRVQIFGLGEGVRYLLTGLADRVTRSEDGQVIIAGRDLSCIPTDTMAEPQTYKQIRASTIIEQRARALKCAPRIRIKPTNRLGKVSTDGSETEWEFWYRFVRRAQMWMWYEPDGTLVIDKLNYEAEPTYYLGTPPDGDNNPGAWIPVEHGEFQSSKQGRVFKQILYYHNAKRLLPIKREDGTLADWLRQPTKLYESKDIHHPTAGVKFLAEEKFETKVGAQEVKLTVPDPGIVIRSNSMAQVNVPELGLAGKWFIVGTRIIADQSGTFQEVRLREKGFALSRRVPEDPQVSQEQPGGSATDFARNLTLTKHPDWAEYFIKAAQQWHGNFDVNWYLAVLLGICDVETGFTNERSHYSGSKDGSVYLPGVHGIEWFEWPVIVTTPIEGVANLLEYRLSFGNDPGGPQVYQAAVGPMQLYDTGIKEAADLMFGGQKDQFRGNRWNPEANIWMGAKYLHDKAVVFGVDRTENEAIWTAVAAYGGSTEYANKVKRRVLTDPGWYTLVQEAYTSWQANKTEPVEAVTGDASQLANGILQYANQNPPKYRDDNGQQIAQLKKVKAGQELQSQCASIGLTPLDPKVLGCLALLLEAGFWVGTFALCEDHDCNTTDGNQSRHSSGHAVDISSLGSQAVGWQSIASGGKACKDLVIQAMQLLKGQKQGVLKPNQLICNGVGMREDAQVASLQLNDFQATNYVTDDHLNHIHVGY